jgi:hypothetical protein
MGVGGAKSKNMFGAGPIAGSAAAIASFAMFA